MSTLSDIGSRFRVEVFGRLVNVVLGLLLITILARLLNPDGYGLLYLTVSVLGIIQVLADLGLKSSNSKYISEYKEKDHSQIYPIIRTTFVMLLVLLFLSSISIFISRAHMADLLGEPQLEDLLIVGIVYILSHSLFSFIRKSLQGLEDIGGTAILAIVQSVTKFILALSFVVGGFGVIGALTGYALSGLIGFLLGIVLLYRNHYEIFRAATELESGLRRRIIEYSIPVTVTTVGRKLDTRFDTILIGFFLNPTAVGFYTVAKQVVAFAQTPAKSLGFTLGPTFGAKKAAGDLEAASRMFEKSLVNTLLLYIPAAVGIVLVAEPAITLVFGGDYANAVPVLQILSLYLILIASNQIISNALHYLGRSKSRAILRSITAVLNLLLNILLIPLFGIVGAATATVITFSLYTIGQGYVAHGELEIQIQYIARQSLIIIMISCMMGAIVYLLSDFISGWLSLILVIGVGVVVWAVSVIATGIIDPKEVFTAL